MSEDRYAEVVEALKDAATNGRITCSEAFELASKLGVELKLVGRAANESAIKIKACQLGCF
jgi:hypothetical protein